MRDMFWRVRPIHLPPIPTLLHARGMDEIDLFTTRAIWVSVVFLVEDSLEEELS